MRRKEKPTRQYRLGSDAAFYAGIASRIRATRRRARLTQRELGNALGHGQILISHIENLHRRPSVLTLARIAVVLGWPGARWFQKWAE